MKKQSTNKCYNSNLKKLFFRKNVNDNNIIVDSIRGRVNLLKQNLAKLDEQHDRVVFLLKTETLAVQLESKQFR